MEKLPRQVYTSEFRHQAVELVIREGLGIAEAFGEAESVDQQVMKLRAALRRPPDAAAGGPAFAGRAPTFDLSSISNTLSEARDICALLPEARLFIDGKRADA
jgi:transposase-like protein